MTNFTNEELASRIDAISKKLNGALGRLLMIRNDARGKEAHAIVLDAAGKLDDLVNELMDDPRESWEDVEKRIAEEKRGEDGGKK